MAWRMAEQLVRRALSHASGSHMVRSTVISLDVRSALSANVMLYIVRIASYYGF